MSLLFLVGIALRALQILIFARVVISFVPAWQHNPWGRIVVQLTEPVLAPFRALTVRSGPVGLDFSPMIVLLIILLVRGMLRV